VGWPFFCFWVETVPDGRHCKEKLPPCLPQAGSEGGRSGLLDEVGVTLIFKEYLEDLGAPLWWLR